MFLFVTGIILSGLLVALAYEKPGFVKLVILGCGCYTSLYLLASGMLMLLTLFSVGTTLAVCDVILLLLCVARFLWRRMEMPKVRFNWKSYFPLLLILLLAGFFSVRTHAGIYGTGQDQGLYQVRAMYYMMDKTEETQDFPEYAKTLTKWEKLRFLEEIRDLSGYYIDEDALKEEGKLEGTFHGLGPFPAWMALWGKLFGLSAMPLAMLSCYLISIGCVWLICRNLWNGRKLFAAAVTFMYAAAPIVLWSGQNSLTEIVMAMCMSLWFAILTDKKENASLQLLGLLPIGGICVVHVTSSVLIPLFVIVYWQAFVASGKKAFVAAAMASALEYGLGFTMMKLRFELYTDGNYLRVYRINDKLINSENMLFWVWGAVVLCLGISLWMFLRGEKFFLRKLMERSTLEGSGRASKIAAIVLLVITIIAIFLEFWKRRELEGVFPLMLFYGYVIMSGFITMPLALAVTIKDSRELFTDRRFFSLGIGLYYVLLMYCVVVSPEVWLYFYFARYLAPFLFLPLVLSGRILSGLPRVAIAVGTLLLTGLTVWQSRVLYQTRDMSITDYEVLEDITACIGENDVVLINEQGFHCQRYYTFPIKALCGADVRFAWEKGLEDQMNRYDRKYDTVFLLSLNVGKTMADPKGWREIYRADIHGSVIEGDTEFALPYPTDWARVDTELVLLVKDTPQEELPEGSEEDDEYYDESKDKDEETEEETEAEGQP